MRQFEVKKEEEGISVLKYTQKLLPKAPSAVLFKAFRKKNIEVNSEKVTGREVLKAGDLVKIFFSEETFDLYCPEYLESAAKRPQLKKEQLKEFSRGIVYEDEDVVILNKKAGMLTQSDATGELSLNDELLSFYEKEFRSRTFRPSVCNRLDRNTSGLVVCGKTHRGLSGMNELIRKGQLKKFYVCIVDGIVEKGGVLKGYLVKDRESNEVKIYEEKVKDSDPVETRYTVSGQMTVKGRPLTVLEVELITGKSHQIRAHMAGIGHPIIGDPKYFNDSSRETSEILGVGRQMLHARRLEFPKLSPPMQKLSGKKVEAPFDDQMNALLKLRGRK